MNWRDSLWWTVPIAPTLVGVFLGARAGLQLTNEQRNQVSTVRLMQSSIRTIVTMGLMLWFTVGFVATRQSALVAKLMNWLLVPGAILAVCWSHVSYWSDPRFSRHLESDF
jgi:hypothetical protein